MKTSTTQKLENARTLKIVNEAYGKNVQAVDSDLMKKTHFRDEKKDKWMTLEGFVVNKKKRPVYYRYIAKGEPFIGPIQDMGKSVSSTPVTRQPSILDTPFSLRY